MEKERNEPLMIKNDYLLKSELTSRIALLLFFGWLISISLTPESDSLDELYRRLALGTAIFGILWTLFSEFKMLIKLIRDDLCIKIYKDEIIYEYMDKKGNKRTLIINNDNIVAIEWSLIPLFGEMNKIVNKNTTLNDKIEYAIGFLPRFFINILFGLIFLILNKFTIKKYFILSTNEYVISIPNKKAIQKYISKPKGFAKITLLNNLIIQNSNILKGEDYAKE